MVKSEAEQITKIMTLLDEEPTYYMNKQIAVDVGLRPAVLLAFMQQIQSENIPIISLEQLKLINEFQSNKTLNTYINKLEKANLIEKHKFTPQEKMVLLSQKRKYGDYGIGDKKCEWCGCNTFSLNGHHYPVSKKDGGTEIVNICPNCHYDFHFLQYEYRCL